MLRSEFTICLLHEQVYLRKYARNQIKCCDPYNIHTSTAKPKVKISFDLCHEMETIQLYVIPGQKLCKRCHEKIRGKIEASKVAPKDLDSNEGKADPDYHDPDAADTSRDELNTLLAELGVSPLTLHAVSSSSLYNGDSSAF